MRFPRLPMHLRQRAQELLEGSRECTGAGHIGLANAYLGAAEALLRGDETGALRWLEKADFENHAIKLTA